MTSDHGSKEVRLILLERLPATLLLTGTSELILFFASVFIALSLSRKYGSWLDKLTIALSPTSAAPPWFYGIFFILIFAAIFRILPFGGLVDSPPPDNKLDYGLNVLKHLILPASAVIVSSIFLSIYNWRTFFLIYSSEDYVEMAKAKGLLPRDVERRYILRPTLPTIITNFALLVITLWTGFTITETVFLWPGLGITLFRAIGFYDTPVIVGSTIIYAYLLAITVFLLDFVYALVDPRVKVGSGRFTMNALKNSIRDLLRYPSAIFGSVIILFLLGVAVYALVTIPYSEAVRLWRGGEDVWYQNPKYAAPAWFNFFTSKKEPVSFAVNTADGSMTKTVTPNSQDISTVDITYSFDYNYDGFPQEMILYFNTKFNEKFPFVSIAWLTPDGRKIRIADMAVDHNVNLPVFPGSKTTEKIENRKCYAGSLCRPQS